MKRLSVLAFCAGLLSSSFAVAQTPTTFPTPTPVQRFVDLNGKALVGGQLFTYGGGSTTKIDTYTDSTGATPNTDPIILNARGEAQVWLLPNVLYKFVLAPANDTDPPTNPIWTVDNIDIDVTSGGGGGGTACGDTGGPGGGTVGQDCVSTGGTGAQWAQEVIGSNAASSSNAAGLTANIQGGVGDGSGAGGAVTLNGGQGGAINGHGGAVDMTGGASVGSAGGVGGLINITGGASTTAKAGSVTITAGSSISTGLSGDITLNAGEGNGDGNININTFNTGGGDGELNLTSGNGINLTATTVAQMNAGTVAQITASDPTNGVDIFGVGGTAAPINLTAATSSGSTTGGAVTIAAGGSPSGTGGAVTVSAGDGGSGSHGGAMTLAAGAPDGNVVINAGSNILSVASGNVTINAGSSTSGPDNGSITLQLAGGSMSAATITLGLGINTNYLVINHMATTCAGAPSGAIINNSGVLNIC